MSALGGFFFESRKARRKSVVLLIRINTALAIFSSENKVRIDAHMIRKNTVLATLA